MAHSFDQPQIVQASHILVICIKDVIDGTFIFHKYFDTDQENIRNVSDEIIEPFKNDLGR